MIKTWNLKKGTNNFKKSSLYMQNYVQQKITLLAVFVIYLMTLPGILAI